MKMEFLLKALYCYFSTRLSFKHCFKLITKDIKFGVLSNDGCMAYIFNYIETIVLEQIRSAIVITRNFEKNWLRKLS